MTTFSHTAGVSGTPQRSTSFASKALLGFSALRQRRALRQLDDAALHDIGVTRSQANAEANRSFWDVPAHWRA